ncbi:helix-turn-helix domain-containing protein [Chitinophaga filiformis]|uniref:helix-turn-helix domain-containing protein n=1 Tax=Chitinophaga filiformis TaxID=104663 RepID=UPI001F3DCCBD|nr:helix-turn-helix domain-containing protein [Chitinophaga filiformis]MCF6401260.1 helix-turn-helix domain-containing protein [Chitinophaga filiformis]
MYPTVFEHNKLLLIDRLDQDYFPAAKIPTEYLPLIIPYAGLYYEQDDDYNMLSQHVRLGPFSLWLHDVFAHKDIVLRPYTPFHLWALHFMYEDTLRAVSPKTPDVFTLGERQCNLFNLYSHMPRIPMPGGKKVLSFHINILPSDLMLLVQHYPGLYYLANKRVQRTSSVINEQPYRINAVCNMLIQNILSCRYIETTAAYFLQRCCLDLFLNFAQQDAIADQIAPYTEEQAALFHQLFIYLTEHPQLNHTVQELAKMFNMSGLKLAQGFRAQFSLGLVPFLHMQKMMMLYHLFMQKACSLQDAVGASGYPNVEEMVKDFEKYYGCNLTALRRNM